MFHKGFLNRVKRFGFPYSLNRSNGFVIELGSRHQTGQTGLAVHQNRTCPAFPGAAAFLGSGQSQVFTKDVHYPPIRRPMNLCVLPVDCADNAHGFVSPLLIYARIPQNSRKFNSLQRRKGDHYFVEYFLCVLCAFAVNNIRNLISEKL